MAEQNKAVTVTLAAATLAAASCAPFYVTANENDSATIANRLTRLVLSFFLFFLPLKTSV